MEVSMDTEALTSMAAVDTTDAVAERVLRTIPLED
jgi:hypothetical protein